MRSESSLHMAHVKEAGFFPCPFMAFSHAEVGVLYWHCIASKWNHFTTFPHVKLVKSCSIETSMTVEGTAGGLSALRKKTR